MTQITERIYVSGASLTEVEGLTGALNVAVDLNRPYFNGEYNKVGLIDGPGNLTGTMLAAVLMLEQMLERNHRVVVFCHMGVSRSVAVIAAYLAYRSKSMTIDDAIRMVKSKHEEADPCQALRELGMLVLRHLKPPGKMQ